MKVIDQQLNEYKESLKGVLHHLQTFTDRIGHEDSIRVIGDIRDRIDDPFMFVIVGEVKAGKSSFINALLGEPGLCAVAPSPMTDTIQQIIFGDEAKVEQISPFLKRVYQPSDILKEIAIVDTPGTNTIIAHHQEITERFIPGSDLIIFVFEAKNPYRQSAWDFFDFMHEAWHKKIIFVLQQKDLMESVDLDINMQGVADHAKQKGIQKPVVFAVSAKEELDGHADTSGFKSLRQYILDQITGGKVQQQKLVSTSDTLLQVTSRLQGGLDDRQRQLDADIAFRDKITQSLTDHGKQARQQCDILVENLMGAYDRVATKYDQELSSALSFFSVLRRSISSVFSKSQSLKAWLESFTQRLKADFGTGMQERINDRVLDLAESIQQMAHTIDLQIRNSQTILANDHEIFSEIALRRQNVLKELREAFDQFLERSENFTTSELVDTDSQVGTNVAAGSGVAIVGIILAAVTQGMVFDITGGVLTALGFLVAGITLGLQRGKVMRQYRNEMEKGRNRLQTELTDELYAYIETIKVKMNNQFLSFDEFIQTETEELSLLQHDLSKMGSELESIKNSVSGMG